VTTDGELVTIDGRSALRFERRYRQPVDRVWRAITEPSEMSQWFPSDVVGERAVGAELRFDDDAQRAAAAAAGEGHRDDGGEHFTGRVVAWDPPKVFSFSWGGEVLRFELHPDGDGTRLVFTQVLSHRSTAARNGAGWHGCLRSLDALLGVDPPEEPDDGWQSFREFLGAMGPEPGARGADGSRTWELGHHVPAERVRDAVSDPDELDGWGGADRADDHVHWDIRSVDGGSVVRVTVEGAADDPDLAATWHTLLVQLDMYLAAGIRVPVEPADFAGLYAP
jgi:uncharacterized protein YndB with AHSA1/START domain